jgi:TfoX N-terminal domain
MSMAMEELSERVRTLTPALQLSDKKMFGGRCFMLAGNMLVCPMKPGSLLVRVGPQFYEAALERPGAQPMTMGARTMGGSSKSVAMF